MSIPVSPPPEGCDVPDPVTVTLNLIATGQPGLSIASSPVGITCTAAAGGTQTCTGEFDENSTVSVLTLPPGANDVVNWTGACTPESGTNPDNVGILQIGTTAVTCTATQVP